MEKGELFMNNQPIGERLMSRTDKKTLGRVKISHLQIDL